MLKVINGNMKVIGLFFTPKYERKRDICDVIV